MLSLLNDREQCDQLLDREIKLAFFDIDGTLLGLDGHYSKRVQTAIFALQERGVKTAIASGRPVFAAQFLIDELGLNDTGLFYTGGLGFNPERGETLFKETLSADLCMRILAAADELGLHAEVYGLDRYWVNRTGELANLHSEHLRSKPGVGGLDLVIRQEPVYKLLFAVDTLAGHSDLEQLESRFPECHFAYAKMAAKPDWLFVSVIPITACKIEGFKQLIAHHGVDASEVMAMGDAHSDKVFLTQAGVGIALGNAAQDVQQCADIVTAPVWEDGVAEVIDRYLALK